MLELINFFKWESGIKGKISHYIVESNGIMLYKIDKKKSVYDKNLFIEKLARFSHHSEIKITRYLKDYITGEIITDKTITVGK